MNIDELLRELIRFSRDNTDMVKVEKMARVVAQQIEREIKERQISAMAATMTLVDQVVGGHA